MRRISSRSAVWLVAVMAGDGTGVITSLDGDYLIEVAPGTELTFSSIGFKDDKVVVPSVETFTYNVVLQSETMNLDDAVVIAYGVRKKGTVAGSVSTVKSEKLENTPTAAFDQALQGQVAGLTVLSSTGEPSASATMTIRGTNSINSVASSSPTGVFNDASSAVYTNFCRSEAHRSLQYSASRSTSTPNTSYSTVKGLKEVVVNRIPL